MLIVKHDFDLPEGIRLNARGWRWPKLRQAAVAKVPLWMPLSSFYI